MQEIIFILDASGSMSMLRDECIAGFNKFVGAQRTASTDARLTLTTFSTDYTVVHNGVPLADVPELDKHTYQPGGGTALLDAVGRTIDEVRKRLDDDDQTPDAVVLAIMTDGQENMSKEYMGKRVPIMIDQVQKDLGWEVVYFGADLNKFVLRDSVDQTKTIGLSYQGGADVMRNFSLANASVLRSRQKVSYDIHALSELPEEDLWSVDVDVNDSADET